MPRPFKPTRPTKLPENAQIVLRDGRRHVKFVERGKVVYYRLTKDGTRYLRPTKVWYFDIRDENGVVRRIRGSADRAVTERMIADWHRRIERKRLGYYDPAEEHLRRPVLQHLEEYEAFLQGKGDTRDHVKLTVARIAAAIGGCGCVFLHEVDAAKVSFWLNALRADRTPIELPPGVETFTPSQAARLLGISGAALRATIKRWNLPATGNGKARRLPRSTVEAVAENQAKGASPATINHYVRALRGFFRWLVRSKRIASNPVETLTLVPTTTDVRRRRRELSEDELRRLLAATRRSTRTFRGLTGEDRHFLYLVAVSTGLRARALANLRPEDFDLDSPSPVVTVPAKFQKNRRTHTVPLAADVAAALKPYIALKRIGSPLWPGTWATSNKAASMLRADLRASGVPYAVEGPEGPEYADFHSLRHTFLTTLGRCGVDLRIAQELAGHSTPLLTARYMHVRLHDLAGAVAKLPSLVSRNETAQVSQTTLLRTGTDGGSTAVPSERGSEKSGLERGPWKNDNDLGAVAAVPPGVPTGDIGRHFFASDGVRHVVCLSDATLAVTPESATPCVDSHPSAQRRARDSNPQPLAGHLISNQTPHHSDTLRKLLYHSLPTCQVRSAGHRPLAICPKTCRKNRQLVVVASAAKAPLLP